jgi:hypothetical protein
MEPGSVKDPQNILAGEYHGQTDRTILLINGNERTDIPKAAILSIETRSDIIVLPVASPTYTEEGPRYTLHGGKIVVERGAEREEIAVDCEHPLALVRNQGHLFVACGTGGRAVYSLLDPMHPALSEPAEPAKGQCIDLAADGTCVNGVQVRFASSTPPSALFIAGWSPT